MLGEMIYKLRKSRNISQVDLAKALNVSKQSVSNWENDNILPSIEMLIRIAHFFSVSTDYLLELNAQHYLEVSGLTLEQLAHIQALIDDIRKSHDSCHDIPCELTKKKSPQMDSSLPIP